MSQTITIPSDRNPYVVEINGVKYEYKAGSSVTVPDEVAALIANNAANAPKQDDPTVNLVTSVSSSSTDKEIPTAKAVYDAIPVVPVADNIADSTADTLAKLVTNHNALLDALKDAGIMEADEADVESK